MGIAVFSGALFGGLARITGRLKPREPFPFGPFIAIGIWLVWLMGPQWWWSQWVALIEP
jgi:leader peptidase (prepilin peptidase)/N-methyltransferase